MVRDAAVPEEPRQQSKSVLREDLIYKGLLLFDRLRCAAARESIIIQTAVHRFRIQLKDRSQTCAASPVDLVQRFTQDELAAVRGVPDIEYGASQPKFQKRFSRFTSTTAL
jgi:hypothetical protein